MSSIIGENYHNATASELSELDAQIAQHQAYLDEALRLLQTCIQNTATKPFYSCHNKLGRSKANLQESVETETRTLAELKRQRDLLVNSIQQTSELSQLQSETANKEAEAGEKTAMARGKQFAVYGGIAGGVLILGLLAFIIFKKAKSKK